MMGRAMTWAASNALLAWLCWAALVAGNSSALVFLKGWVGLVFVMGLYCLSTTMQAELRKKPPSVLVPLNWAVDVAMAGAMVWYGHPGLAAMFLVGNAFMSSVYLNREGT